MTQFVGEAVRGGIRTVTKVVFGALFIVPFFGGGALALWGFAFDGPLVLALFGLVLVVGVIALGAMLMGVMSR